MFHRLTARLLLIVAVATLPLVANDFLVYHAEREGQRELVAQRLTAALRTALAPEQLVRDNLRQVLRIMALADEIDGRLDDGRCSALAARLLRSQSNFINLGAVSLDGTLLCSGLPTRAAINNADRPWFREAMARNDFSDGHLIVGRVSGQRSIAVGLPLHDARGRPRAVLFAALKMDWLGALVAQTPLPEGWMMAVHGVDGFVFARHPDPQGLAGTVAPEHELLAYLRGRPAESMRELAGPGGVRRLYVVAPLAMASGEIYVTVGAEPAAIFGRIEADFRRALVLTLLLAVVALAFAWLVVRRDFGAFADALGAAIARLGGGDLAARAGWRGSVRELDVIAVGFDRMAGDLEALDATHRRDLERLREAHAMIDGVVGSTVAAIYVFDLDGRCRLANPTLANMFGRRVEDMVGLRREDFLPAETAREHRANDLAVIDADGPLQFEESRADPADGLRHYLTTKFPLRDAEGRVHAVAGVSTDITERKRIELDRLLASLVFDASAEGIVVTDAERRILRINRRFGEITGYATEDVLGRDPGLLSSGVQDAAFYQAMWRRLRDEGRWEGEITNRRKDGTLYPEWLSIAAVPGELGEPRYYVGLFSDLTQRKALDARVQHLQNHDALTGLPNRNLFIDRLQQAVEMARRDAGKVAVMWINLNRFRVLNDNSGHLVGDAVLVECGLRLRAVARAGDSPVRLSGDQFGLLVAGVADESDLHHLARRVIDALRVPMTVLGKTLSVSASIGIALFPRDGGDLEALMKAADVALARAKEAGRDTFRFFAANMDIDAERRLMLEAELHGALARGELTLYYQPQIELATGRVCGTEALLRWTHPRLGPVSPVEFIPLAEQAALIQDIGAWTLREACRQNKAWLDAGLPPLPVAVNLSARQFQQDDLVELVADALATSGLPPSLLELELTETAFVGDVAAAAAMVHRIKALGVQLALDDFGAGYSSLAHLSGFPFDKIKIDQGFIHDITSNPVNAAIATAAIAMGRSLDMVVLAEGVETDGQLAFLRGRQCEAMQGHLFSKALPVAEATALLQAGQALKVGVGDTAPVRTLLLVDDERNILNALRRALRRDGYEILAAESAREALELLARHPVQVIVSDQRMPEMTGTDFLEKAKHLYPDTVRMILSGYTDVDSITGAINRGAIYRFLTKPWDDDTLRAEVREAFRVAEGFAGGGGVNEPSA